MFTKKASSTASTAVPFRAQARCSPGCAAIHRRRDGAQQLVDLAIGFVAALRAHDICRSLGTCIAPKSDGFIELGQAETDEISERIEPRRHGRIRRGNIAQRGQRAHRSVRCSSVSAGVTWIVGDYEIAFRQIGVAHATIERAHRVHYGQRAACLRGHRLGSVRSLIGQPTHHADHEGGQVGCHDVRAEGKSEHERDLSASHAIVPPPRP